MLEQALSGKGIQYYPLIIKESIIKVNGPKLRAKLLIKSSTYKVNNKLIISVVVTALDVILKTSMNAKDLACRFQQ